MSRAARLRRSFDADRLARAHAAMSAAAEVGHYEISYDIAKRHGLDTCPICVMGKHKHVQRVYLVRHPNLVMWICEMCADRHCSRRSKSHEAPVAFLSYVARKAIREAHAASKSIMIQSMYDPSPLASPKQLMSFRLSSLLKKLTDQWAPIDPTVVNLIQFDFATLEQRVVDAEAEAV